MLKTLYQIGKEISEGRDPWEDILVPPKLSNKDREKRLYVLPLVFDLDKGEMTPPQKTDLRFFSQDNTRFLKEIRSLKIQGGNNKSIYVAADAGKLEQLSKTLFGKPSRNGSYPDHGEFIEALDKEAPELVDSQLYRILKKIPQCRTSFLNHFTNDKGKLSIKEVEEAFGFSNQDKIVLVFATVNSEDSGLNKVPLGDLEGYEEFIQRKFFSEKPKATEKTTKLCYATGEVLDDIQEAEFAGRYNINKFFVKTTQNYATGFDGKKYAQNYQLSAEVESYLNRGSQHLLDHCITDIAGIRHVIIPEFFRGEKMRIRDLSSLKKRSDLLFLPQEWGAILTYLEMNADVEGLYWLNFVAIDSDGNYFKVGNQIKDVSKLHLVNVFEAVKNSGQLLKPWLGGKYGFNLYSVYKSIPVRKDKENVNAAFLIPKSLLEQRPIEPRSLFRHFKELILCHWFERYRAYANITPSDRDYFAFSVRDAVFQYLAFLEVLHELNLIEFSHKNPELMKEETSIGQDIEAFLDRMRYTEDQRALFHLGRVLNRVVYTQSVEKGHKKNALDKLNYNGMDKQSIYRFANELFESSRHYDITKRIEWDWGRFSRTFNMNDWNMDSQEALFYILSGYAYGIQAKSNKEENNNDHQN